MKEMPLQKLRFLRFTFWIYSVLCVDSFFKGANSVVCTETRERMWHECTLVLPRSAFCSILPVLPSPCSILPVLPSPCSILPVLPPPQSRWSISNRQKGFSLAKVVAFNICVNRMAWWLQGDDIRGTNEIRVEVVKPWNCFLWPHYKLFANKPTEEPITWSELWYLCAAFSVLTTMSSTVSIPMAARSKARVFGLSLLELRVWIPLAVWMSVPCAYCVLSRKGLIPLLGETCRLCMYPRVRSGETITLYIYEWGQKGRNKQNRKQERKTERKEEDSFIVCVIVFHNLEQNWELYRIM